MYIQKYKYFLSPFPPIVAAPHGRLSGRISTAQAAPSTKDYDWSVTKSLHSDDLKLFLRYCGEVGFIIPAQFPLLTASQTFIELRTSLGCQTLTALDPYSGWGDRAMAAIGTLAPLGPTTIRYHGIDANPNLARRQTRPCMLRPCMLRKNICKRPRKHCKLSRKGFKARLQS